MEPVNNQDVLIRLLKDGHISEDEFKSIYSACENESMRIFEKFRDQHINQEPPFFVPLKQYDPFTPVYPANEPFIHLYDPNSGPFYTYTTN